MTPLTDAAEPPFGTHAPGALARALRAAAGRLGEGRGARMLRSALFTLGGFRARRPFDVAVFGDQRARLHGYDNLSEKRVLRSERCWDAAERAFVADRARAGAGPFRFLDVGANAGLYTLAARSAAAAAGRPFRAAAVEPQPEMLNRLRFNLAASGALEEVAVCPWAAAAGRGRLVLAAPGRNRGEARIQREGAGVTVETRALPEAAALLGGRADVMKIDIEGQEAPALAVLFEALATSDWPRAIVIESGGGDLTLPGPALCLARGYVVEGVTRLNALLRAPAA